MTCNLIPTCQQFSIKPFKLLYRIPFTQQGLCAIKILQMTKMLVICFLYFFFFKKISLKKKKSILNHFVWSALILLKKKKSSAELNGNLKGYKKKDLNHPSHHIKHPPVVDLYTLKPTIRVGI